MWNSNPPSLPAPPPPLSPQPTMGKGPHQRSVTVTPTRNNVSDGIQVPAGSVRKHRVAFVADNHKHQSNNNNNISSTPNNNKQAEELEALRQRGLAKLLNKHFSQETQRLAAEKAAVDAALLDLEQRKARNTHSSNNNNNSNSNNNLNSSSVLATPSPSPQKSHGSNTGGTSPSTPLAAATPMDELYSKIHRMKAECKQKEKETLLLYQRYVHKFGFTGQIKVPTVQEDSRKTLTRSGASSNDTPTPADPPVTPTQPKRQAQRNIITSTTNTTTTTTTPTIVRKSIVQSSVEKIQQSLSRMTHTSGTPTATLSQSQKHQQPTPATVTPTNEPLSASQQQQQQQQRSSHNHNHSRHNSPTQEIVLRSFCHDDDGDDDNNNEDGLLARYLRNQQEQQASPMAEDDEISSLISGLTSVDSATTRQILLDCELTVATFLDEERKAIQAQLLLQQQQQQQQQGEHDDDDEEDRNGLGAHHRRNRAAMDSLSLPNLQQTSQSKKKNKKTGGGGSSSNKSVNSAASSPMINVQTHAALEAETMAEQMQQILRDFEQAADEKSLGSSSAASFTTQDKQQTPQKGKPFHTNNAGESWTVLWDHQHQRNYYYERNSGTTQWLKPAVDEPNVNTTASRALVLDPEEVMPESVSVVSNTSERVRKYRAKRRRRRRKRILRVVAAVALVAGSGYYYYYHRNHTKNTNSTPLSHDMVTTTARPSPATAEIRQAVSPTPPPTTERGGYSTPPTARNLGHLHSAMRNQASASEEKRSEKQRLQKLEEDARDKEVVGGTDSTWSQMAASLVTKSSLDDDNSNNNNTNNSLAQKPARPWGCNIPFAYVTSKHCRKLANEQPLLNEKELFMLQ